MFVRACVFSTVTMLIFAACNSVDDTSVDEAAITNPALARAGELADRRLDWTVTASTCDGWPSKDDCDDGDMTLFSGLLCGSGEPSGCAAVRASRSGSGRRPDRRRPLAKKRSGCSAPR